MNGPRLCSIAAFLFVGAAGIFGLIDQPSMIAITAVLICCLPEARRCGFAKAA